jgi:polar amino acid transport system substrate-binding protein
LNTSSRKCLKLSHWIAKLYILIFIVFYIPIIYAETEIIINTGSGQPFISPGGNGFYNEIVKEIFLRLNLKANVIALPAARSILNANQGIDDGVIARIEGMENKYKNIIRVPGKIITFEFVAYSLNRKIPISDWNSLKPHSVGIIRGWRIYEKNVVGTKKLTTVTNPMQLFNLLLNKRSDLILFEGHRGRWWNKVLNANAHIIGNPIAKKDMYLYMNKKHIKLIPNITEILILIKKDGTFNKIKDRTLDKIMDKSKTP